MCVCVSALVKNKAKAGYKERIIDNMCMRERERDGGGGIGPMLMCKVMRKRP